MARELDPENPLVAAAVFGKQVEDFLVSDIGVYLLEKALEEERKSTEDLVENAAKWTPKQLMECQSIIWRAKSFRQWLGVAYNQGLQALKLGEEEALGG